MVKDTIIEIVQKLLVKTTDKGCTEAEAASALKKAQELMLEYNLSLAEVSQTEVEKTSWIRTEAWKGRGLPWEMRFVCNILENHFFVKVVFMRGYRGSSTKVCLFGDKENVEVAKHILIFLSRTFRDLWQQYRRWNGAQGHGSRAFYLGLSHGLQSKLREERRVHVEEHKGQNALMVITGQLTKAFKKEFPDCKSMGQRPVQGDNEYDEGRRQGKQINIHKAIRSEHDRRALK